MLIEIFIITFHVKSHLKTKLYLDLQITFVQKLYQLLVGDILCNYNLKSRIMLSILTHD